MSEPTPKRPDPTRPAVQQAAKDHDRLKTRPAGPIPVAKRLESSLVISKSYRVRELPPPPVVVTPQSDRAETDDRQPHDTLPDGLAPPPEKHPEPPIELDALQIRAPGGGVFCAPSFAFLRAGNSGWSIPSGETVSVWD